MTNSELQVPAHSNNATGVQKWTEHEPFIDIQARERFVKRLNEKPNRVEKQNGADSIPISFLETELDEVYLGIWSTKDFTFQVIANEIVGQLTLEVFDPTAKVWIRRVGAGAVMIRQTKDAMLTDIAAKIKNGLAMDFPKLRSMCLKNAAKTLGKRFGRDLNRKFEDEYETAYSNEIELNEQIEPLTNALSQATTLDDLKRIWDENPEFQGNPLIKKLFTSRKATLGMRK